MKKILSFLLACLMGLSMASGILAAETDTEVVSDDILVLEDFPKDTPSSLFLESMYPCSNFIACPKENCTIASKVYTTFDKNGFQVSAMCPVHGLVPLYSAKPETPNTPDNDDTTTEPNEYTIKTFATRGGYIIVNGNLPQNVTIKEGESAKITVGTHLGYELIGVTVNGINIGAKEEFILKNVKHNYNIRAYYMPVDIYTAHSITAAVNGNGYISTSLNGNYVGNNQGVKAKYTDSVTMFFVPNSKNYSVKDVVINGESMGAISSYEFTRLKGSVTVSVTFEWNCNFTDVSSNYMSAVEFVYENGIMDAESIFNKRLFNGKDNLSIYAMGCYLAELADTGDMLNTPEDRIAWAKDHGLIKKSDKLSAYVNVKRACKMILDYVRLMEENDNITYVDLKNIEAAHEMGIAMGLFTKEAYIKNGLITRYDTALICHAISQLKVK